MPRGSLQLALMVGVLLLSGCSQIQITDSEWCGSLGASGAACFSTLSNKTEALTLQQWAKRWTDLSNPQVCTNVQTLTDWKADIEKLCTLSGECTAQVQSQVDAFAAKLNAAHSTAVMVTK